MLLSTVRSYNTEIMNRTQQNIVCWNSTEARIVEMNYDFQQGWWPKFVNLGATGESKIQ